MGDLGGQAAFFADADGLADAVEDMGGFFAHMGVMHASHGARDFFDLDHFFGRGEVAGNVEQSRGDAESSVEHGLTGDLPHLFEFLGSRRAVDEALDLFANAALAGKRAEIGSRMGGGDSRSRNGAMGERRVCQSGPLHQRGNALADVIFCRGSDENSAPGVRMDVDTARGDDQALGVECERMRHGGVRRLPRMAAMESPLMATSP